MFQEEGTYYTSHVWITGIDDIAFECSFTVPKGGTVQEAEEVIATLEIRKEGQKYPAELIPVRLSEIYQINEGYEWTVSTVKQELKKDFQGTEDDLEKLQQMIDNGKIGPKKKDEYGKKYISRAVLCERQQGEERNCPHHGTGYNQRNGGTVQLQTEHLKDALGCQGQPCQREERGGKGNEPCARQYQGANHQALPAHIRP